MALACNLNNSFESKFKVGVVGGGNVGVAAAYAMLMDSSPTELVLIDRSKEKAEGIMMDFEHAMSFLPYKVVVASDDYAALKDAHIIFVTVGARQQEGESRLMLIEKNRAIFREIIPKIRAVAPTSVLVIVSNPVDILTHEAIKLAQFPPGRVFGTGTWLDTARFRFHIADKLCLNPASVNAYILGEHGDTSFPVLSSANIAGKILTDFEGFTQEIAEKCYQDARSDAYRIIHDMGYTCYSIAIVMREIMRAVFHHSRIVVPLSVELHDYYGHNGVTLSIPCVLDSTGVEDVVKIPLNQKEQEMLAMSVETMKKLYI